MVFTTGNGNAIAADTNMIELYENGWAEPMAKDCATAKRSITISAISMFPPLRQSEAAFNQLWRAWTEAAGRGIYVLFVLPAQQLAHPATMRNAHAARIAYDAKMHTRFVPGPRLLHAKSVIIDSTSVWIGSGNMTSAAAMQNHELYVNFKSEECAHRIERKLFDIANPL